MTGLSPQRPIRPHGRERDRVVAFISAKAASCQRAGHAETARHLAIIAEDIGKGLHE